MDLRPRLRRPWLRLTWLTARRLSALGLLPLIAVSIAGGSRSGLLAPSPSLVLYDRHGSFLAEVESRDGGGADRGYGYWTLQALPPRVVAATLALEDRRFWQHPGVDPFAVVRAAWQNLQSGRRVSGASTIAMQVVRLQHPARRSYVNKLIEAAAAVIMTVRHGREQVLAHYLRVVPYGNRIHGIAYAARRYFDKPVEDLNWAEIAFLSAIPQSPARMNPFDPRGRHRAIRRGRRILQALRAKDVLSAQEYDLASAQLRRLRVPARRQRPAEAMHAILRMEALLRSPRWAGYFADRPRIRTALDLRLQRMLAGLAEKKLGRWRERGAGNVAAIVLGRDGNEVLAWLGSADYFDARYAGAIDYTQVRRSPGSALKPFIYALALERRTIDAATVLDDLPHNGYPVRNADLRYLGPMLPRQALANSRNVPAAHLAEAVGLHEVYAVLRQLGLHDARRPAEHYGLAMALGGLPVTLESLVGAYGALADEGVRRELRWFLDAPAAPPQRVFSPETARQVTLFLSDPLARLPSFPRMGTTEYPFPVALKTGTSQGYRDAWTVAYSTRYLIGAWTGHPEPRPMNHLSGAGSTADLAQELLIALHHRERHGLHDLGFPAPAGYVPVRLCATSGKLASDACPRTIEEWLPKDRVPTERDQTYYRLAVDRRSGQPATASTPDEFRQMRTYVALPARYAEWAASSQAGTPAPGVPAPVPGRTAPSLPGAAVKVSITSPRQGAQVMANPEAPPSANTLALAAVVEPPVEQIVWYLDGEPFALAAYPYTARLPLTRGEHVIQARVPLTEERSTPVRILME